MENLKTVVYVGPSISSKEIHDVIPTVQLRSPVARGDLFREEWNCGDTAVIIDGYFGDQLSVGHKEILWLIKQGVHVIGGSSMGALRAAELSLYGMSGVGKVFDMYASGEVIGDDEVALIHGPGELGYPAITIAMVNIRYGCHEAVKTGQIKEEIAERIMDVAKSLHFSKRTWVDMENALDSNTGNSLKMLKQMIYTGEWDLKRLDAKLALRSVGRRRMKGSDAWTSDFELMRITNYQALRWKSLREYVPGRYMSDFDVLNAARLFDQNYPELHERVLTGMLRKFAEIQGLDLSIYACTKLGVGDSSDLPPILESWLTKSELANLSKTEQRRLLLVRVWPTWQSTDWQPMILRCMKESTDWPKWSNIVIRADDLTARNGNQLGLLSPTICGKLFLRHWCSQVTSVQIEMARRGFYSIEDLGYTVRRFFALDIQNTVGSKESYT